MANKQQQHHQHQQQPTENTSSSQSEPTGYAESVHITLNTIELDSRAGASGLTRKGKIISGTVFATTICALFLLLAFTVSSSHEGGKENTIVQPALLVKTSAPSVPTTLEQISIPAEPPTITITSSRPEENEYEARNTNNTRKALMKLYTDLDGAEWVQNDNWNTTNTSVCGWYGITCGEDEAGDSNYHVVSIDLFMNSLSGTLSSEIGMISTLRELKLNANKIYSIIPTEIGLLSKLETFDIEKNQFTSTLPSSISNCSSLKTFSAGRNSFHGMIPSELGTLSNSLEHASLYFNEFTGTLPSELGNLKLLNAVFNVMKNNLTGTIPSELGKLHKLTYMNFIYNSFTGTIPSELGMLHEVSYMNFGYNNFTGSVPDEVCALQEKLSDRFIVDGGVHCDCCVFINIASTDDNV